jgi:hypothetical protein
MLLLLVAKVATQIFFDLCDLSSLQLWIYINISVTDDDAEHEKSPDEHTSLELSNVLGAL